MGTPGTVDILGNDDFLPGADTSITDTGNGTATGTVTFDPMTGEMTYTPAPGEEGTQVTVEYTVCNEAVDPAVCDTALVTIEVAPACDLTDAAQDCDMDGNPNGTDPNPSVPTATDDGVFPM